MRTVTIVMGRYLPGYKDGGPVRSIQNLTERLSTEFHFQIITQDRDHGDKVPYPDVRVHEWNKGEHADIFYVKPNGFTHKIMKKALAGSDLIYVCGCFNDYARMILKMKKRNEIPCEVVIAAMGLFSPGAFQIKRFKKELYMGYLRLFGYLKDIIWSATSMSECEDIRRVADKKATCHVAQDLPRQFKPVKSSTTKKSGELKLIFLSRISRKKNLKYVIEILTKLDMNIQLDIYGIMEDISYWEECLELLKKLPSSIQWKYCGEVDSEQVLSVFSKYHLFFFPTLGENFGHVIHEAMAAGCVPLISDQTPWSQMDTEGILEVCSLSQPERFEAIVKDYYHMNEEDFEAKSNAAQEYALKISLQDNVVDGYRRLFNV